MSRLLCLLAILASISHAVDAYAQTVFPITRIPHWSENDNLQRAKTRCGAWFFSGLSGGFDSESISDVLALQTGAVATFSGGEAIVFLSEARAFVLAPVGTTANLVEAAASVDALYTLDNYFGMWTHVLGHAISDGAYRVEPNTVLPLLTSPVVEIEFNLSLRGDGVAGFNNIIELRNDIGNDPLVRDGSWIMAAGGWGGFLPWWVVGEIETLDDGKVQIFGLYPNLSSLTFFGRRRVTVGHEFLAYANCGQASGPGGFPGGSYTGFAVLTGVSAAWVSDESLLGALPAIELLTTMP